MEERFVRRVSDQLASFQDAIAWTQAVFDREFSRSRDVQVVIEQPPGSTVWTALVSGTCIIEK